MTIVDSDIVRASHQGACARRGKDGVSLLASLSCLVDALLHESREIEAGLVADETSGARSLYVAPERTRRGR